ncbi:hypothetical protein [Stenotrophomonas maltophilia]|uniref:hypothetical protein n=1 Tax=Stenotrophomonas maltophilia TaxID=40324 RepID=UPI0007F8A7B9|nr:hypothetical protein [Stenotrophomonas maltophilia]OBU70190.1 hypothetical protein A9J40_01600 [Stenotrophomonas maltophilia]
MSIKCTLGLVACLTYGGASITAQDAVDILDSCEVARTAPRDSLVEAIADSIAAKTGKRITWPAGSATPTKRQAVLRECAAFSRKFNDDSAWKNLDKWPF